MPDMNAARQTESLAYVRSGAEFVFGAAADCPLPPAELLALSPDSEGVEMVLDSGLSAQVLKLRTPRGSFAIKRARATSKVHNVDGETAFLNELRRHAEIAELRAAGTEFPGVIAPHFGSLRQGLVVSDWIAGTRVAHWNERQLEQVLESGRVLIENGFFEWDFCPGNILDDGAQTWLFDFGYLYRFDPLRQFNTAGSGAEYPVFHLAERLETRNLFAWLLDVETTQGQQAALAHFCQIKEIALATYGRLSSNLRRRRAHTAVLDWLAGICEEWRSALAGDITSLYLREAWRSHRLDVYDDLHGKSATPTTLRRCDWLLAAIANDHTLLRRSGVLDKEERALDAGALLARYEALREEASACLQR